MPITPIHMGVGLLGKGALGGRFSLLIFAVSQALIDLEPIYYALSHAPPLHRQAHTLGGACVVTLILLLCGAPCYGLCARLWNPAFTFAGHSYRLLRERISPAAAGGSAAFGAFSHVLLDGMLYSDMHLLWPLGTSNPFLGMMDYQAVVWLCAVSFWVGWFLLVLRLWLGKI